MNTEVRQQIEAAGMDGAIIDELSAIRDEIIMVNIQLEALKGSTSKKTAVNVAELNAIYKQVIGICKKAHRLLPDVPTSSEEFSFARILKRLHELLGSNGLL